MPTIDVRGTRIAYSDQGDGEPVLALHCSGASGAQWRGLHARLGARYRIVAPDLHGHGASDPWPGLGPMKLADESRIVSRLVARSSAPVHLVGHSYGGALALSAALAHAGRLRSLTLVEPAAFHLLDTKDASDRAPRAEVAAVASEIAEALLCGDSHSAMRVFVDYWNGTGAWARIDARRRTELARGIGAWIAHFRALTNEPVPLAAYASLRVPTLVVRGTETRAPTARIAQRIAATIPGARLAEVAGAGHMVATTHRDEVATLVHAHIAGTPAVCEEPPRFALGA